ncbi:hypothetical protein H5410_014001 [Solanum commersonii]|uniref:Uncharacterized protein n=1 Tax=Solanum commersonii TaxID=4109 RepID=A0A9J5ZPS3_SOLCO|nr:hypothetical protein H5410_014001 [Solanum commersonii]
MEQNHSRKSENAKANALNQLDDLEEIQEQRSLVEGDPEPCGLSREIETQVFSIEQQTNIEESTPLILKVNGVEITEPKEIKKEIVEYYERLYTQSGEWRLLLDMRGCPRIDAVI